LRFAMHGLAHACTACVCMASKSVFLFDIPKIANTSQTAWHWKNTRKSKANVSFLNVLLYWLVIFKHGGSCLRTYV
jgi:hypothetical protein